MLGNYRVVSQPVASRILLSSVELVSYSYSRFGARGSVVVKALCHKPEGRGFETRRS
jgi:hypothetical protein